MQRSWTISQWLPSAVAIGCMITAWPVLAGEAPDTAKLAALVRQDCGSCHGLSLKGGLGKPLTAERLAPWDRDQILHIILDGVPGTPMPPWRPLLTESEARWIANKLKQGTLQ